MGSASRFRAAGGSPRGWRPGGDPGGGRWKAARPAVVCDNGQSAYTPGSSVTDGPLIVQSDKTLLLEVDHPQSGEARAAIAPFAELERSPEHVHTYRLT